MFEDVKKKRELYERKIEVILTEFEKELPPEIMIENAVVIRSALTDRLKCGTKLVVEDLNQ